MSEKRKKEIQWGNTQNILVEEEGAHDDAESSEGSDVDEPENEYLCRANDVLEIKLVRTEQDIRDDSAVFHPTFTHQVFGQDEQIVGYKNLRMKLYYNASTLHTYINMKHDGCMLPSNASTPLDRLINEKIDWHESAQVPIGHSYTEVLEEFIMHLDDKFTPAGVQVHSYTTEDDSRTFEVYKGTTEDPNVRKYYERLQTFVLWFIDASWYIDSADHKWDIYFLFEKYKDELHRVRYAISGFATVYRFFGYPDNVRYRISQFLILPPFQRQGHGTRFLEAIYNNRPKNTLEICVEDPSDEFQMLRDRLDLRLFRDYVESRSDLKDSEIMWSKDFCSDVKKALKLNKGQVRRCYEIYKLEKIKTSSETDTTEREKKYRLEVKQRLFNLYDLYTAIEDAEERKQKLQEIYDLTVEQYFELIAH